MAHQARVMAMDNHHEVIRHILHSKDMAHQPFHHHHQVKAILKGMVKASIANRLQATHLSSNRMMLLHLANILHSHISNRMVPLHQVNIPHRRNSTNSPRMVALLKHLMEPRLPSHTARLRQCRHVLRQDTFPPKTLKSILPVPRMGSVKP